jgi:Zn-dependent protease with chaperone function
VTSGVLLAAYAVTAGFGAPAALCRIWARRSPRIAIGLWLTLAASWVAAVPLAALTLLTPASLTWQASGGRAAANPGGIADWTPAAVAAIMLAVAIVLRASWHVVTGLASDRREHRAHAAFLAAVGRPDQALNAVILDTDAPAASCLPRGRHRVVVSASAVSRLSPGQLQAVLAHERAHLRGHHHLMLAVAAALARAFPAIPLLSRAAAELAALAEMTADDAATRRHHAADLAAALVTLAGAGSRATALTAGGPEAIARVQRLLAPRTQPPLLVRTARLAAAAAAVGIPAVIACLPLVIAACGVIARD